jgi:hypothetical protein
MRWGCLLLVLLLAGCQTVLTPGSAYRQSGSIVDLLAEPTLDLGSHTSVDTFYSLRVPHYGADGHGFYDIPIVFCEQLLFAPVWVFSGLLRVSGCEPYLQAPWTPPAGMGSATKTPIWVTRKSIAWIVATPGVGCYIVGFCATMAFDTAAHDVPVIVIGKPIGLVRDLILRR